MAKDDDLGELHRVADWFGLADDEREGFIKQGMEKLGYQMRQTIEWDEPEGSQPQGNVSFFGGGQRQQAPRGNAPQGGGQRRASGQYPNG